VKDEARERLPYGKPRLHPIGLNAAVFILSKKKNNKMQTNPDRKRIIAEDTHVPSTRYKPRK
jgi:hypothetical protein